MKKSLAALLLLLLYSCTSDDLKIDVEEVKLPRLALKRLDRDLFTLNDGKFDLNAETLRKAYGRDYEHYLMNPLRLNGSGDSLYKKTILSFVQDKDIREANAEIQSVYTDEKMQELVTGLEDCIRHFRYYFPEKPVPTKLVTCQTGWNYACAFVDSTVFLGLDMYLGSASKFYGMLAYPQYQVRKMNGHYILPDLARGWLLTEFDTAEAQYTLLDHCVFYGKLFYGVKALLPETEDSLIIGYSSPQMKYCITYEKKLWGYFAEKNRLFENNRELVRELTSEGPFTGSISKECPPRIAMWIGWQLVKSYMKRNKDVSLKQLMRENDAQKILNKSKYRP
ncbi:MAG TPA: hypothetical protein PLQ93_12695 [Bacteroidia bacterium]|nr:hypothetical protein [Bacteroidia bacterium]